MKSLLMSTWRYFYKVYNYYDSRTYSYKRSEILSRLDGLGYGFSLAEWSYVIYRTPLWIMLCGIFF
jgi:hypothetical protein